MIPILILELVYDTIARYVFNSPTEWSYDVSYMLYGAVFMLGSAHTLQVDRHVRIETLYARLSQRGKALIDALGYLFFFFPVMTAMVYFGGKFAHRSWQMLEKSSDSMWQPPIYYFKTLLPLAALLILIQGIIQFIRCVLILVRKEQTDD